MSENKSMPDMKKIDECEIPTALKEIVMSVLKERGGKNGVICLHEIYNTPIVIDELSVRRIIDDLIYRGELCKVSPNHVKVV